MGEPEPRGATSPGSAIAPIAATPEPPYYAVVFTSRRAGDGPDGYAEMAERMVELAAGQPGFLGIESVRGEDGVGITVSYWSSPEAIAAWKAHAEHETAQRLGRERWYAEYRLRVCKVEREYGLKARPMNPTTASNAAPTPGS